MAFFSIQLTRLVGGNSARSGAYCLRFIQDHLLYPFDTVDMILRLFLLHFTDKMGLDSVFHIPSSRWARRSRLQMIRLLHYP